MTHHLEVDATASGTPLVHHWSRVVGAGRAAEALRVGWWEQLERARAAAGFEFVRFHGLFHDDMFVYRREGGQTRLNFQYIDEVFDRLLSLGVRPFVEFGFMPGDLARTKGTVFWWKANGSPPTDWDEWANLVTATLTHWVERYGLDEVRQWYFEVWNEPNLAPFWQGTRSEYFRLYDITARAVKSVDAALRVGGPATSNFVPDQRFAGEIEDTTEHRAVREAADLAALDWHPVWVADFLASCHENALPVDFVSCHPYPTDWALDEHGQGLKLTRDVDATPRDMARVREVVANSAYPSAEIHLTEWSSSSSSRDHTHDSLPAATFIVRTNLASIGLANSLAYWTFTDIFEEEGGGPEPLHGGFGMITLQGWAKPTFHAYRMLHQLGNELLASTDVGVVTRSDSGLRALFFHYPDEVALTVPASFDSRDVADRTAASGRDRTVTVRITGLRPGTSFDVETLDAEHGSVVHAWRTAGSPQNPTREQSAAIAAAAAGTGHATAAADANGVLDLVLTLRPWGVVGVWCGLVTDSE